MNRYQFEDLISDYIENKLPIAKRKTLEAFMEENPEAKEQLESIRSLMKSMKKLPEVKTSDRFTAKLMKRVEFEKNRPSSKQYVSSTVGKTVELLLVFGTNCIPTTTKATTNAVITVA